MLLYTSADMALALIREVILGKVMDPMNGVQTALMGQFINIFFFLYFFATGCHLLTVKLFAYTYEVIPVGAGVVFAPNILWYVITLSAAVFLMAVKLALPFVAAEFVLEMTIGVLMKLIPQIHVFVINIQCKILMGIILMIVFAYPMGEFLDGYIESMMGEVQNIISMLA